MLILSDIPLKHLSQMYKILVLLLILLSNQALSHSGRTNSEGCHNNRKTGQYHCHNKKKKITRKPQSTTRTLLQGASSNFKCENKTVCAQMRSCAEAKFYLKECKVHSLDGDNDGIPCESIC